MRLIDLTTDVPSWLGARDAAGEFTEWVAGLAPETQIGFSGLGPSPGMRPGTPEWDDVVKSEICHLCDVRTPLLELIKRGSWRRYVAAGIKRAQKLLGGSLNHVDVIVSVGLGRRNASMGYWGGRGLAFLWLEHFLATDAGTPYLDLGVDAMPIWAAHEIAHAVRYSLPGTGSLLPEALSGQDPWMFWSVLEELPLWERFVDEGLATSFAEAAFPEVGSSQIIGMSLAELQWLEDNWVDLVRERWAAWDFTCAQPSPAWVLESLCYDPGRANPPWNFDRPPGRWGYFVGRCVVSRHGAGSWTAKLAEDRHTFDWRQPPE